MSKISFTHVPVGPEDKIVGLWDEFNRDTREKKINLCPGVYRNENGQPEVLESVRKAEFLLPQIFQDHEYLPIQGYTPFTEVAVKLGLGAKSPVILENRYASTQTIGGTSGVRVGAIFLKRFSPGPKIIYISNPTYAIHRPILEDAGLEVREHRYIDQKTFGLDFQGFLDDIEEMPEKSIILLHPCGHNPTGVDPTAEQWAQLSRVILRKQLFPFFDMAYQGMVSGDFDKDAFAVRKFIEDGHQIALAQSFAKSMGLYGERVGTLTFVCTSQAEVAKVLSQLKIIIRPLYSNPSLHGARLAYLILSRQELKEAWMSEVATMCARLTKVRELLHSKLREVGSKRNWDHILNQKGMFCFSGLTEDEVNRLKTDYAVYLLVSGRIAIPHINEANVQYLAESIKQVAG